MGTESPNWVYGMKSSFAAGELTPTIEGRADLPLYQNGAKKIINWMILPSGGLTRRPGTEFIWGKQAHLAILPDEDDRFTPPQEAAAAADRGDVGVPVPDVSVPGEPVPEAPMPTAQDLTSRLCRLRNKLEERSPFFDYGILDREDAVYSGRNEEGRA
jgi:hypothetical protein